MRTRSKVTLLGVTLLGAAGVGTGVAVASGGGEDAGDAAITGPALEQASAAALEFTGEGRVTGTEAGDEESAYEVEVTLEDGSQVDVQLDETFAVVSSETENGSEDGSETEDGPED